MLDSRPHCLLTIYAVFSGQWKTSEIGQIGFFIEVELELKEKKAGKLGGMKNWYYLFLELAFWLIFFLKSS